MNKLLCDPLSCCTRVRLRSYQVEAINSDEGGSSECMCGGNIIVLGQGDTKRCNWTVKTQPQTAVRLNTETLGHEISE